MSDKKPAHVVVVEMVRETIEMINKVKDAGGLKGIEFIKQVGRLSAEAEMLERMVIPEKHCEEVAESIREIKAGSSFKNIDSVLPEAVFMAIAAPPAEKAEA